MPRETRGLVGLGIDDRRGAGDKIGDEMAGAGGDAEAMAATIRPGGAASSPMAGTPSGVESI